MERENEETRQPEIIGSTYEIIGKIGAGGGGNIFLANHLRLGKKVVLKADKRKITTRPELLRREVDILKELNHPYIPGVYDFFVENETVYTAMDYIEGESLDKPLKRGERFSQPQVVKWAIQLLKALSYLHSPIHGDPPRGFVHSDIKPANLMRTRDGDICLIDFNIALALGEENIIGCSAGYASPEHYGLDFSSSGETVREEDEVLISETEVESGEETEVSVERTLAEPISAPGFSGMSGRSSGSFSSPKKVIVPDVRSDIYSTGATLYHLLSGRRPSRNARQVKPLSKEEFSPLIVDIITKAMNPNPDLRYQTADEMLYDFTHLHKRDPRLKRLKRVRAGVSALFLCGILAGTASTFTGLKRMQTEENWLKLAEYSANALETGDLDLAVSYAMQALPERQSFLDPQYTAEAQWALAEALGVYDLVDGFQALNTAQLPSAPFGIALSPSGKYLSAIYTGEAAILETESGKTAAQLPIQDSAMSDCLFIDDSRVVYAGDSGVAVYDFQNGQEIWRGETAVTLALSGDGTVTAAADRAADRAKIYRTEDGTLLGECSFYGKQLPAAVNDIFADPENRVFALNASGTLLAASFSDGGLYIFDLENPENDMILYEQSDYTKFFGGFCGTYFAYAVGGNGSSEFGIIDTEAAAYIGGLESQDAFVLQADETGIYLANGNLLVRFAPETLEEQELAYTDNANITGFSIGTNGYVLVSADDNTAVFYDGGAHRVSLETGEKPFEFVCLSGLYALTANRSDPSVRKWKLETHEEAQLACYDPRYIHDEARISQDGKTTMLYSYEDFRIYDRNGQELARGELPEAEYIYDQQFRKTEKGSWLEVIWYDGTVRCYSAADGSLISEEQKEPPEENLYEEFYTDRYRVTSPLHGTPEVYDLESGKKVENLESEDYLTYVTAYGDGLITEYITADGQRYGLWLDEDLEPVAYLPGLCDIWENTAVFDDLSGNLRQSRLYSLQELKDLGELYLEKKEE